MQALERLEDAKATEEQETLYRLEWKDFSARLARKMPSEDPKKVIILEEEYEEFKDIVIFKWDNKTDLD